MDKLLFYCLLPLAAWGVIAKDDGRNNHNNNHTSNHQSNTTTTTTSIYNPTTNLPHNQPNSLSNLYHNQPQQANDNQPQDNPHNQLQQANHPQPQDNHHNQPKTNNNQPTANPYDNLPTQSKPYNNPYDNLPPQTNHNHNHNHNAINYQDHNHNALPPFVDILPPGPFYDVERSANVTTLVDQQATLNCRVNKIGNRTVSWLRDRDTHLLTVGPYTYTSDQRFRVRHTMGSEDWALTISYAQVRDTGKYECQVSTTPPMKHYIWLTVVEPKTAILGGPDVFINRGSNINLTCVVDYTPHPPTYLIWSHNNKVITYDSDRGGVSVVTEKGPRTTTNLLVRGASFADSGTYNCKPSTAPQASVTVHILNGEQQEAMQHAGHSPSKVSALLLLSAAWVLILDLN